MQIGGPQELNKEQVEKLYEIRRQMGLKGKHPANLCPNAKAGKPSCPGRGGGCAASGAEAPTADADLIASITKKVMDQWEPISPRKENEHERSKVFIFTRGLSEK